jgi:hypothetical protein
MNIMTTRGLLPITATTAATVSMNLGRHNATKMDLSSSLDDFLENLSKVTLAGRKAAKAKTTMNVSTLQHSFAFKKRTHGDMLLVTEEDLGALQRIKHPRNLPPAPQHVQGGRFLFPGTGLSRPATGIGEISNLNYNEPCVVEELDVFVSTKGTFGLSLPLPRRTRVIPPSA